MPFRNESLERLAVALALGLLIGLERGWERRELPEGQRAAGFRTFGLIGLLGGVTALLSTHPEEFLLGALAIALGLILALGYWRESEHEQYVGLTTTIAGLLTFVLGAMAGRGELTAAASTAVVVTLLLGFKPELHGFVQRIERPELLATFRLLLISVVLLPILPDRGLGPWQSFNPYQVWWMVVLVAGLSYVAYFAIKLLGEERGILMTGLLGGMVSSTAVAVSVARATKDEPDQDIPAAGIVAASSIMFIRIIAVVAVVAPSLVVSLLWSMLPATVIGFAGAAWYAWRGREQEPAQAGTGLTLRNPLDLTIAVQFGLLLSLIMVLSQAARHLIGAAGLYFVAGLSGLVDLDAITLSVSSMSKQGQIAIAVSSTAIALAAAVNTLVKPTLVLAISGRRLGFRVFVPLLAALLAGGIGFWLSGSY